MKISVIIPTRNEAENIVFAIDRAWAAGADEVIIADGQSRDRTCQRVQECDAKLIRADPGRGIQLNAGASVANGDVLLFIHADNFLVENGCQQIREQLPKEIAFGAFRQKIDHHSRVYRWLEKGNAWRAGWRKMPYGDQGIFVRKSAFEKVGGFPGIPLMEDVALVDRLNQISRPILLPGPLNVSSRRWEKHGVFRQTIRNWILFARYRLGASPEKLAVSYRQHDEGSDAENQIVD